MASPANKTFTCNITLQYDGVLTLNGLTNSFNTPPSGTNGNPPVVYQVVQGSASSPVAVPAVMTCGGATIKLPEGDSRVGYADTITYNLPDGKLLTIEMEYSNSWSLKTGRATISSGSIFQISYQNLSGSTLNITVKTQ